MRGRSRAVQVGLVFIMLLVGVVRANGQPPNPAVQFGNLVRKMETILPQTKQPVTQDRIEELREVLVVLDSTLPDVQQTQAFQQLVPQSRIVAETQMFPITGIFGRIQGYQPRIVQREVTEMVAMAAPRPPVYASAQSPQHGPSASPQSAPMAAAPESPMTTIKSNVAALLASIDKIPVAATGTINNGDTSFRHLAIQTYSLVISAQRLNIDTQPGNVIGLPHIPRVDAP